MVGNLMFLRKYKLYVRVNICLKLNISLHSYWIYISNFKRGADFFLLFNNGIYFSQFNYFIHKKDYILRHIF